MKLYYENTAWIWKFAKSSDRINVTAALMVSFASNVITLGDVVSMGSPAGVGAGRSQPVFMKDGDVSVCTIEGIGTLTNPGVGPDAR